MSLQLPPLYLRRNQVDPLTAAQHDYNMETLRNGWNAISNLVFRALNPDGTLKDGAVDRTEVLADRIITWAKMKDLVYGTIAGTNTYTATYSPTIGAYTQGQGFVLRVTGGANTIRTVTIDGYPVRKLSGQEPSVGDIAGVVFVVFDTTGSDHFIMVNGSNPATSFPTLSIKQAQAVWQDSSHPDITANLALPAADYEWTEIEIELIWQHQSDGSPGSATAHLEIDSLTAPTANGVTNSGATFDVGNSDDGTLCLWTYKGAVPPSKIAVDPLPIKAVADAMTHTNDTYIHSAYLLCRAWSIPA